MLIISKDHISYFKFISKFCTIVTLLLDEMERILFFVLDVEIKE